MASESKIIEDVKETLRRYYRFDDKGRPNKGYDEAFSAQDAVDEIHDIVGDI